MWWGSYEPHSKTRCEPIIRHFSFLLFRHTHLLNFCFWRGLQVSHSRGPHARWWWWWESQTDTHTEAEILYIPAWTDSDGLGGRRRQRFIKERSWKISPGCVGAQRLREDVCHPAAPGRGEPVVAQTRRDMDSPRSVVCGLRCLRLRYSRSAAQIGRLGCRLQQQQQQQRK